MVGDLSHYVSQAIRDDNNNNGILCVVAVHNVTTTISNERYKN